MRARRSLLTLLLPLALATACASRPHSNPFDPANPETGGRPAGFVALAGSGFVDLRWSAAGVGGDVGFQIYRRVEGEADFSAVTDVLPGFVTSYGDFSLQNGRRHEYRLYYVFGGVLGGLPAEDSATPGTTRAYVTELDRPALDWLTPDGRHVRGRATEAFGPTFLAYDRRRSRLWVSDTFDGSVRSYDPILGPQASIVGLSEPVSLAVDSLNGDLWICDQGRGSVFHYTTLGAPRAPTSLDGLSFPTGIALDPADGSLWVCERSGNRVRRFFRSGVPNGVTDVFAPSRVAVDSSTREPWITSFDGRNVVHLNASGTPVDTIALDGPIGLTVDPRRGRIWIADSRAGRLVALRRSGLVEFTVGGLSRVNEVDVDLATGECWAAVPGLAAVVRVAPDGRVLAQTGGLANPYDVLVDTGP